MTDKFEGRVKVGEEEKIRPRSRAAWDPDSYGYGKHEYHRIDPELINPEEYAQSMRGDQEHKGEVREYNTAFNSKHPENDVGLDWLGRPGTIIVTEAPGLEGTWKVTSMPVRRDGMTFSLMTPVDSNENPTAQEEEISVIALGCAANKENLYEQVKTSLVKKVVLGNKYREELTKR